LTVINAAFAQGYSIEEITSQVNK